MKLSIAAALAVAALAVAPSSVSAVSMPAGTPGTNDWTYKTSANGLPGPAHWGETYKTCAGKRQSPIDITYVDESQGQLPLELSGSCTAYNVTQHYDSFKAEVQGGSCVAKCEGKSYTFAQVHFHAPSEHTVDGVPYDAEAHFVHKADDGSIIVIGIFLQRSDDDTAGTEPFFAKFFETLDDVEENDPVPATLGLFHTAVKNAISEGYVFNYPGGLTVPPCSEVVTWYVVETPLVVSEEDYETITTNLKRIVAATADGKNARPTQPLHGRKIVAF